MATSKKRTPQQMHEDAEAVYGCEVCCAPVLGPGPSKVVLNANRIGYYTKAAPKDGSLGVGSKVTQ